MRMEARTWLLVACWVVVTTLGLSALHSLTADYRPGPVPKDEALHRLGVYVLGAASVLAASTLVARRKPFLLGIMMLLGVVALGVSETKSGDIREQSNCACVMRIDSK